MSPVLPPNTEAQKESSSRDRNLEVLHRFALSQAPLKTLDDIVWNIAKTAIAELGFEDCVVYLLSEDGKSLLQIAAHGNKNPNSREIFNPIVIEVGKGIVGDVARTGQMQWVPDTREDPRYILDDRYRLSELAVPIIHQGKVIGVLDSEHSEVNFFTEEHIKLFTTISSLASTRIDTALAVSRLTNTVQQLQEAKQQLQIQAKQLEEASHAAEAASRAKSEFLANISHEIRTPMTAIVGFAELLSQPDVKTEHQLKWRDQLVRNARYLQNLIGNVLDVSAVEAGAVGVEIDEVGLYPLIKDAVEIMRPRAEAKGLALSLNTLTALPDTVFTDKLKLQKIAINLLSNAIKYTPTGSVAINLSAQPADQRCELSLAVTDTGIGIAEHALQQIFVPFSRVHDKKRLASIEGTGLGLVLVKQFVDALQGRINIESTPGVGSTFEVIFTCDVPANVSWQQVDGLAPTLPATTRSNPLDADLSMQGLRILCCEDSEPIAMLLQTLLAARGAEVTLCDDGQMGITAFENAMTAGAPYDLVIMDMQMPILDGYDATPIIKQLAPAVPVIALTAFALKEDSQRCLAAGCDFYLTKPIDPSVFARQINSLFKDFTHPRQNHTLEVPTSNPFNPGR